MLSVHLHQILSQLTPWTQESDSRTQLSDYTLYLNKVFLCDYDESNRILQINGLRVFIVLFSLKYKNYTFEI